MALQEEFESQGNFLFKYRGTLPLILLGGSLLMFIYTQINKLGYDRLIAYEHYEYIAIIVTFLGLAIRIFTVGYAARNTSGRNTQKQVADTVNTSGIYSTVRHPLYVGNFLMWLGPALMVQNLWFIIAFVFIYWVYYERIMFAEEQFLRKKFNTQYTDWAARTPAFILSFKNYLLPKETFSLKKILRQEKNGFLAIFVVFYIFRAIREYINTKEIDTHSWIFFALLASLALYIIIKIILKISNLLEDER